MSDLSRLLGDVYSASTAPESEEAETDALAADHVPEALQARDPADDDPPPPVFELGPEPTPGWADDKLLDEAFADWVPGPGPDASASERTAMAPPPPDPDDAAAWLAPPSPPAVEAESTWFLDTEAEPAAVVDDTVGVDDGPWSRGTDDLLPGGRRGRRLALRRR